MHYLNLDQACQNSKHHIGFKNQIAVFGQQFNNITMNIFF